MPELSITCPQCGKEYWVDEADIGLMADCEACGAEFEVEAPDKPSMKAGVSSLDKTQSTPFGVSCTAEAIVARETEAGRLLRTLLGPAVGLLRVLKAFQAQREGAATRRSLSRPTMKLEEKVAGKRGGATREQTPERARSVDLACVAPDSTVPRRAQPQINSPSRTMPEKEPDREPAVEAKFRIGDALLFRRARMRRAMRRERVHVIRSLLRVSPSLLHITDRRGRTPLEISMRHAMSGSDVDEISLLLRSSPSLVGVRDEHDRTPLDIAMSALVRRGDLAAEEFRHLPLKHLGSVALTDALRSIPFEFCGPDVDPSMGAEEADVIRRGARRIAVFLLEAGADINGAGGKAPMVAAVEFWNVWFTRFLLDRGANPLHAIETATRYMKAAQETASVLGGTDPGGLVARMKQISVLLKDAVDRKMEENAAVQKKRENTPVQVVPCMAFPCPHCGFRVERVPSWPSRGNRVPFYAQTDLEEAGAYHIEFACPRCNKTGYVVWDADPL